MSQKGVCIDERRRERERVCICACVRENACMCAHLRCMTIQTVFNFCHILRANISG